MEGKTDIRLAEIAFLVNGLCRQEIERASPEANPKLKTSNLNSDQ
jgi:hypothetical protein